MTTAHKAAWTLAGLLLVGLVWAGKAWHEERLVHENLSATLKTQDSSQAAIDKEKDSVVQDLKQRVDALERIKAAVVTPSEVIKQIPVYLPQNLPAPVTPIVQPAPAGSAPNAPPVITGMNVPVADLKPLFDQLVGCRECTSELEAANAQMKLDDQKVQSITTERNAAVKAAKGGSVWQRVKHHAETIVISAAAGYVIGRAVK